MATNPLSFTFLLSLFPSPSELISSVMIKTNQLMSSVAFSTLLKLSYSATQFLNAPTLVDTGKVVVSANDTLVRNFLRNKIKFNDISKILLKTINSKEFLKLKKVKPKNVKVVSNLANYVSLKVASMCI